MWLLWESPKTPQLPRDTQVPTSYWRTDFGIFNHAKKAAHINENEVCSTNKWYQRKQDMAPAPA